MSDDRPDLPLPPAPPPAPGGPLRAAWQLLLPVLAIGVLLAVVAASLGGLAVWLLRHDSGTAWLLARVPGLEVKGPQGALLSDRFAVERLVVRWDGGRQWVAIDGFVGSGLRWRWHPEPGIWLGLDAQALQARRVEVQTGPPGARPITMPRTLGLPLRLNAAQIEVTELQIDSLPPMQAVQGRQLRLWEPGGREYHAELLAFDWDRARIEGTVSLGAQPPFTLQAQATATSRGDGPAWSAQARAAGPLARFDLQATLRGQAAVRTAPPPSLDAEATITPLEAWPLGRLRLLTQGLDLQALYSAAPRTALAGRMDIDSRSFTGPLGAAIELDNALPGRWDQGRVPVRRLQARLRSPDNDRSRLQIEAFDVLLAQGSEAAGRWQGSGLWTAERLQIDSRVENLRPQLLDSRAPVMTLSGPLAFGVSGLPSPDPRAPAVAAARRAPWAVDLRSTLEGRIEGSPHAVTLDIDGNADAQRVSLRSLRADAGSARVALALDARRSGSGPWQLRTSGTLADFDPVPWWPGPEGSAWRSGTHRLSGSWSLDLTLPRLIADVPPLALAQGVAGNGQLRIERAQLAGVPVTMLLELGQRAGGGGAPGRVEGELVLGGNRLLVKGQGNPLGDGREDRLQFDLQAANLATLEPLARLLPEGAAWAPRGGSAQARLTLDGRWPDIRSEGEAELLALQTGSLTARLLRTRWRFDTGGDDPLSVQVSAQGLVQGAQRLEQLQAELRGTWRQHRLDLAAALPVSPPPALQAGLGLQAGAGTLLRIGADGQWAGDGGGGGRWAGRVTQLALLPWRGSGLDPVDAAARPWLEARELRAELRYDARDGFTDLQAAAGQLRLADAATLRWDEVRMDLRGERAAFALRADIEPFALAPLLARAQPAMGWQGDLRLAARVDLRVGDQVDADIVFERRDGDLRLSEENASTPFGLSDLRLVASAHEGRWQLAGAFAGRTLGEASARLNLRTRPEQRWPDAATPIDGVIEGHVANLGIWGTWVPPGWRISGELRTSASVSGRVGEPDYAGEVRASNVAVRNLLLGVDVTQGEALVRLRGAGAEIERFTLRGGDGQLSVRGSARLADKPGATLQIEAERFRVLGRIDRQLIASGRLELGLAADLLRVQGQVKVDEGLFDLGRSDAPSLDDDVSIRQARPAGPEAEVTPAVAARPRRLQQVAVDLDLGDQLRVRGRGLDTTLTGQLKLGSSAGRLTVRGIVSAGGGTYAAYGQKLDIDRGLVIFSGELENPALDILALRPDLDMQVGVAITGTPIAPRVRLYSNVDMSESDRLSWLVLGRASDGLGRADTALIQRAAVALLAGEGEAPTDTLLRNLGLDTLSLRQSGEGEVRETVITLGKQLSRRWYVGYERGVNATTGTWQLIYRIAQRFTLRAQSGAENSLDLIWVWRLEHKPPEPMPKSPGSAPP